VPVIPADPVSPVVIVLSIVILAVALGLFVMLLKDESASPARPRPGALMGVTDEPGPSPILEPATDAAMGISAEADELKSGAQFHHRLL
jgi:hypothetical protein